MEGGLREGCERLECTAPFCVTQSKLSQGHIETCKLQISHMGARICSVAVSVCMSHKAEYTIMFLYHTYTHVCLSTFVRTYIDFQSFPLFCTA